VVVFEPEILERVFFQKKRTFNRAERDFWLIVGWGELEVYDPKFLHFRLSEQSTKS